MGEYIERLEMYGFRRRALDKDIKTDKENVVQIRERWLADNCVMYEIAAYEVDRDDVEKRVLSLEEMRSILDKIMQFLHSNSANTMWVDYAMGSYNDDNKG